jgi:alpha-glucosidase
MSTSEWWKQSICYQIYPRSFADSNGDGIGDIRGIIDKLDYLQWLGVTALWISPIFPSPNLDWGYDVSDYTDVHPDLGTLAEIDRLIEQAHQCDIRILLDFVPNHTSNQHPWFQQSKSSKDNPYRDWYIWRDGADSQPPNRWESIFGGSAWTLDPETGQYYYHFFLPQQPDLNWRNPDVREAMLSAMRFWLDRGIDGFRMDAIALLYEAEDLSDTHSTMSLQDMYIDSRMGVFDDSPSMDDKLQYQSNQPGTHDVLREMRALVDEYDAILLGETDDIIFYGNGSDQLNSMFNFDLLGELKAERIRDVIQDRTQKLPTDVWDANTFSNHDRIRSYTVFKDGHHSDERARIALALVMFLPGTPVFYYGEEIGMENLRPKSLDDVKDTMSFVYYNALRNNRGFDHKEAFAITVDYISRDGCRTPMQWDNTANAGFSPNGVKTWLSIHPNFANGINVVDQKTQTDSMLSYFRALVQLRNAHPTLQTGKIDIILTGDDVLAFWRTHKGNRILVILNISANAATFTSDDLALDVLFSGSGNNSQTKTNAIQLMPYEIVLAKRK